MGKKWAKNGHPYQEPVIKDHNGDVSKQWLVYYRYWSESHQEMKVGRKSEWRHLQPNRTKDQRERYAQLGTLRDIISLLLKEGWTPDKKFDPGKLFPNQVQDTMQIASMEQSIQAILEIKERDLAENTYRNFKGIITHFSGWLQYAGLFYKKPDEIRRAHILDYLRHVQDTCGKNGGKASNRTRNNYKDTLYTVFETMKMEEMASKNPVEGIKSLAEAVERHVPFTPEQMLLIAHWMDVNYPYLKVYSYFIGYAFLRPSEILNLQVQDINLKGRLIYLRSKKAKVRTSEAIPIIDKLYPVIEKMLKGRVKPTYYLFSIDHEPGPKRIAKTDYFSRKFNKCKDWLNEHHESGMTDDHSIYGMRHTFIQDIYQTFRKTMTKEQAEYAILPITRHKTIEALRKYIRDYSMEIPADWGEAYSIDY